MTRKQFVAAIEKLGYTQHNAHELLGIARSTVSRIVGGKSKVPAVVELLLEMYLRYGAPPSKKIGGRTFRSWEP